LLGGAILPGLSLWSEMLSTRTAQLPSVSPRRPATALGRTTEAGIVSGIFHGHAGAIRELVQRIRREAFGRKDVVVVGTGGNARRFSQEKIFDVVVSDLVLHGLRDFAARQKSSDAWI
jgi:type III pantothenate kinase